ncbi:hypothetical protein F4781DRAFT_200313 [Annulohypoxylon bovei var. microspora]|nr:hypothetical protein F4781DRAFT_200313 [Annulohypoxylon bovei var. microspora]
MITFADLCPELRLRIWDLALQQEAHDRLLIVYQEYRCGRLNILPLKHNASPFLSVNYESRNRAQAFYSIKLPIYEILEVSCKPAHDGLEARTPGFLAIERGLNPKGTLYISPQWDVFVIILNKDSVYSHRDENFLGTGQDQRIVPFQYITADIPYGVTGKICNVACVQEEELNSSGYLWAYSKDEKKCKRLLSARTPHTISSSNTYRLWKVDCFGGIENYQYLCLNRAEVDIFVFNVIEHGGRGSYDFRKMVIYPNEPVPGAWVLFDLGELQKQNRKIPEPELKLKPRYMFIEDIPAWHTTLQFESCESSDFWGIFRNWSELC